MNLAFENGLRASWGPNTEAVTRAQPALVKGSPSARRNCHQRLIEFQTSVCRRHTSVFNVRSPASVGRGTRKVEHGDSSGSFESRNYFENPSHLLDGKIRPGIFPATPLPPSTLCSRFFIRLTRAREEFYKATADQRVY